MTVRHESDGRFRGTGYEFRFLHRRSGSGTAEPPIKYTTGELALRYKASVRGLLRKYNVFDDRLLSSKHENDENNFYIERVAAHLLHHTFQDNAQNIDPVLLSYLNEALPIPVNPLPGNNDLIRKDHDLDKAANMAALNIINEARAVSLENRLKEYIVRVLQGDTTIPIPYSNLAEIAIGKALKEYRARWGELPPKDKGRVSDINVVEPK